MRSARRLKFKVKNMSWRKDRCRSLEVLQTRHLQTALASSFHSAERHPSSHMSAPEPPTLHLCTPMPDPWHNLKEIADQRSEGACPKSHCSTVLASDPAQVAGWLHAVSDSKLVPTHCAIEGHSAAHDHTYPDCIQPRQIKASRRASGEKPLAEASSHDNGSCTQRPRAGRLGSSKPK